MSSFLQNQVDRETAGHRLDRQYPVGSAWHYVYATNLPVEVQAQAWLFSLGIGPGLASSTGIKGVGNAPQTTAVPIDRMINGRLWRFVVQPSTTAHLVDVYMWG